MYESFMVAIQEKRATTVKYSTAGCALGRFWSRRRGKRNETICRKNNECEVFMF